MNENIFWLGVWALLALVIVVGIFPIASCQKQEQAQTVVIYSKAIERGCSVVPVANGNLHVACGYKGGEK